ncbi:carbohydrate ABC transporter permease [Microaceticoccus formicicus]|uniref:carbohydrate ABC transporter permease n=1 Tax=Microaceticoccus formicicus TaxID=3118105 RepID=UPI003CD0345C|nr:carbohydrate ABC transporter permease [Peptoniphilaceae bacterium AMB_02]
MNKETGRLYKAFIYLCLIILAISIIVPVSWVFMASLKANSEFQGNPWTLPASIMWSNYLKAWRDAGMGDYFFNSVITTSLGLIILLVVSIPCAYVLSRMEFKGRKFLTRYLKSGLFVNISYIVIPIFLMLLAWNRKIGKPIFTNNLFVLATIYAATAIPFTVYLLSNYFRSISKTYEEAAYIDGAGYFKTMVDIMVPMAKPSIITIILFNFLAFWNEYIMALTLLTDTKKTLPVGLVSLMQSQRAAANYGPMYAGLVIVMLPTLILYMMVQRRLTDAMMVGGDKG